MDKEKIIISSDSTIALTKEEIKANNLNVLPLNVIVDGVEYHDTIDMDNDKLALMMRNGSIISTSTPTIGEITSYFDNLFETTKADKIIHFTISSKLSSMFSLFTKVCNEKYKDKVIVYDSLSVCTWMANQVFYAKKLVEDGLDEMQIIEKVNTLKGTEDSVFIPESLKYLKRGGRIKPSIASLASLIKVLPTLSFKDGEINKKNLTRTRYKALRGALKEWQKNIPNLKSDYELVILNSDSSNSDKIKEIIDLISENIDNISYKVTTLSLNVVAHAGPGTVGIGIQKKWK